MPPVKLDAGVSQDEAINYIAENFLKRQADPMSINPVWMEWRDDALKGLYDLKILIGQTISLGTATVRLKHIGGLVLKNIPDHDILGQLDYTEVKELFQYAKNTWSYHSKDDYKRLVKKNKDIQKQIRTIQSAGAEYGY